MLKNKHAGNFLGGEFLGNTRAVAVETCAALKNFSPGCWKGEIGGFRRGLGDALSHMVHTQLKNKPTQTDQINTTWV